MTKNLVTSSGVTVQIFRELGRGGGGSVFEIPSLSTQVAKVYHEAPDAKKQAKLRFMMKVADRELMSYAAWPQDTLHLSRGGPVVGFLMPKVADRDAIHMVYSPAHRRQERPKAAWDFLLYVARNTAAAFSTLHEHGHILGDVNQGNVMVGANSSVMLIDCDSFQVKDGNRTYLCEVGVSHFTPPELQGISSFEGVARTANHDNFGLALLIFHLLFGGRHPFSGVPLRNGVGEALETDIKSFRYAYADDAATRGFAPPPRSIPVSILPDAMQSMFKAAFTEAGAGGGRPTAAQWVTSLDGLRGRLRKCGASSMHVYPAKLTICPWCALEKSGVFYFIDLGSNFNQSNSGFDLAKTWAMIQLVAPPPMILVPNFADFSLSATPLPPAVIGNSLINLFRTIALIAGLLLTTSIGAYWFWGLVATWAGWAFAGTIGQGPRTVERGRRTAALRTAQELYDKVLSQLGKEAGPEGFAAKKSELEKLREEHYALPKLMKNELDLLHSTAHERQKQKFLDKFFIDNATIAGLGPARKAALRSFGIETAADVTSQGVRQVRGFGEGLTRAVMDWRASCERRFTFDPRQAVSETDKNSVLAKFAGRKQQLELALSAGAHELQRYRQNSSKWAAQLGPAIESAARQVAQARIDLSLL